MTPDQIRTLQRPLKERYRSDPRTALITLEATGTLDESSVTCQVPTFAGMATAGLHPAAGGDGTQACSGDMLLQALVACAGVTLRAVATAMNIPIRGGTVRAEGDLDFRGTLGMTREVPTGFQAIRVRFDLETDAPAEQLAKLKELTERYCVVAQTLLVSPTLSVSLETTA
jgi:uncharacterized OsmC-like protein